MRSDKDFLHRYGPWAVVAGGSEGIGAEFARQLAARGLRLLLIARRTEPLEALAAEVRDRSGVEVCTAAIDLASPELPAQLTAAVAGREVGLMVYNAAHSAMGPFLGRGLDEVLRAVDVNCRGLVTLAHTLGRPMTERRRGGLVVMGSMAGGHGSPLVATYAGTKAFDLVFAEGLWEELGRDGVDVLVCRAGATRTPAYERSRPKGGDSLVGEPREVAAAALASLGVRPVVIPGWRNALAAFFLDRLLPRRSAIEIMARAVRSMYDGPP
jgi:short-subunit dehydrogenase